MNVQMSAKKQKIHQKYQDQQTINEKLKKNKQNMNWNIKKIAFTILIKEYIIFLKRTSNDKYKLFSYLIISDYNQINTCSNRKSSDNIMPRLTITIVPKQIGQLWDDILQQILKDICKPPVQIPHLPLTSLLKHRYYQPYQLFQGQCYQQHSPNLCGYHATFNTLCLLHLLNGASTPYDITSGACFWSFKKKVQVFLGDIKRQRYLGQEWPWRQKDIQFGDFQRTYNKLCLERFQEFDIFRRHQHFELHNYTWQFQYGNLIGGQQQLMLFQKIANQFKNHQEERPLVVSFMLAITNHWMSLVAVKQNNKTQYWFFDSFNRDILTLNQQQMQKKAQELNQQRIKTKGEPFSPFFLQHLPICWKDTQVSLKLIIDCLEGRSSIEHYHYNQQFNVFLQEIQVNWNNKNALMMTLKAYWHNIASFFRYPLRYHLFDQKNKVRFKKLLDISVQLRMQQDQGKRLHNLLKPYQTSFLNKATI